MICVNIETGPEGPASRCFVMVYTRFSELLGHSLLGDQEDDGREDQHAADHIEDRGTDTTGAGKLGAMIVLNIDFINCNCAIHKPHSSKLFISYIDILRRHDLYSHISIELVISSRCLSFFEFVYTCIKTMQSYDTIFRRCKNCAICEVFLPSNETIIGIKLCNPILVLVVQKELRAAQRNRFDPVLSV